MKRKAAPSEAPRPWHSPAPRPFHTEHPPPTPAGQGGHGWLDFSTGAWYGCVVESKTANLEPHTEFLWTRADYDDLVAKGVFTSADKVELLNGKILTMSPQHARHSTACALVAKWLNAVFAQGHDVRTQMPLALGDRSEPEPDLAVVRGDIRDYADHHPMAADTILIVEISDSSLAIDRGLKLEAYARAGIPEYWIVNLADSVLEVHRAPAGEAYKNVQTLGREDSVAPIGHEGMATKVAELLP